MDKQGTASDDDGPQGAKPRKAKAGPTIDLTAQDLSSPATPDDVAAAASGVPAGEAASPAAAAEPPTLGDAPQAEAPRDDAASPQPEPPLDLFGAQPPAERSLVVPMLGAALAGGVVGGLVVLLLGSVFSGGRSADETLAPRLGAVEQVVASMGDTVTRTVTRVGEVELAAKGANDNAQNAIALAQEAKSSASPAPASTPGDSGLEKRVGALEASAPAAVQQTQVELAALKTRLDALDAAVAARSPDRAAAYAVALSQLAEALRDGRPFAAELQAATTLGGTDQALASLQPMAAAGAPTVALLSASFDALVPALVAAVTPKPAETPAAEPGVFDRLWSGLASVVTVTREDAPDEQAAAAPIKAVAEALHRGDLAGALAAFDAMPPAAKAAGAAWATQAKARTAADALVRTQSAAALRSLSARPASPTPPPSSN